jgi:hypothetical protein
VAVNDEAALADVVTTLALRRHVTTAGGCVNKQHDIVVKLVVVVAVWFYGRRWLEPVRHRRGSGGVGAPW